MPDASIGFDGFPAPRRWRAKWIWAPNAGAERNVYYLFRRVFSLDAVPATARAVLTADTRYQLFVNDTFVGRGPPQSQPYFQYYDEHDVTSRLQTGTNCVAVLVNHLGTLPDTRGGLLFELIDGEGACLIGSDAEWRVQRGHAWWDGGFLMRMNKATPFQEFFDARKVPDGWRTADFDDSAWDPAQVMKGRISDRPPAVTPWSRLVPRDIPFMAEREVAPERIERVDEVLDLANRLRADDLSTGLSTVGQPVSHSSVQNADALAGATGAAVFQCSTKHQDRVFDGIYDPCVVLDFGRVLTAYPRLALDGPAGSVVELGYAERLIDGHFNNAIEGQFADCCTLAGGPTIYEPFTWKAFRYLKLRFRNAQEPITVRSVTAKVTTYPYEERGGFGSSDETLNQIFAISRNTLRLCSNEFLMDTPWREQAQWLGDVAAVTLGGIYACFGDARLPGKFLRQAAANAFPTGLLANVSNSASHGWSGVIPDYSLWWVMGLWNHYLYTGEKRWLHAFYPTAVRILQAHLQYTNEHGLIEDMPYWVFIDWADTDRRGECTALNALFFGALEALEKMARFRGDAHTADLASEAQTRLQANLQKRLFDPDRGCFADARVDDELSVKVSEHANLAAIRWGLCDDDTAAGIVQRFYEDRSIPYTEAQPFFTAVALQALDRIGRFDLALEIIRERWGDRMVARGATSTYEEWGMNGSWRSGTYMGFMRTLSHAWSAHPAEFLIRHLAGLEILEPGCARVRLAPRTVDFAYSVTFPTPQGPVTVEQIGGAVQTSAPEGVAIVS